MSETRTDIACQALDLLLLLLARDDDSDAAKRAERQSVVAGAEQGLLSEMLAHVAFSRAEAFSYAPVACRERAMRVVGALVQEHPTNQYNVGEVSPCSEEVVVDSTFCDRDSFFWSNYSRLRGRPLDEELPAILCKKFHSWCTIMFLSYLGHDIHRFCTVVFS